jgi:hypothetical protein
MAKANKKSEIVSTPVETSKTFLEDLSREELLCRYNDNVATRKALTEENKILCDLYKGAVSSAKKSNAEAKIAALQAKLEALKNPSPIASEIVSDPVSEEVPAELVG